MSQSQICFGKLTSLAFIWYQACFPTPKKRPHAWPQSWPTKIFAVFQKNPKKWHALQENGPSSKTGESFWKLSISCNSLSQGLSIKKNCLNSKGSFSPWKMGRKLGHVRSKFSFFWKKQKSRLNFVKSRYLRELAFLFANFHINREPTSSTFWRYLGFPSTLLHCGDMRATPGG